MAKRNSAGNVVELISHFPWWVGVAAALVGFVLLRWIAGLEVPVPNDAEKTGSLLGRHLIKAVAIGGQWILPALLLTGALFSFLEQRKRAALHADVAKRGELSLSPFAEMSWQDFERVTAEYFRQQGFAVAETSGGGADGGVDIVLARGADRYLVQCKQWRALRVGVEPVRELYGLIHACRAAGGFVVTSGTFTTDAKRFAEGREIALIDGMQLAKAIRQQALRPHIERLSPAPRESAGATPVCPQCKSRSCPFEWCKSTGPEG
jgi:restriction system protein